jgi:hypothetical protein
VFSSRRPTLRRIRDEVEGSYIVTAGWPMLFVTQRIDRIELGGFLGRDEAKQDADEGR